jgi:CoA:oxalate CoA-transferase
MPEQELGALAGVRVLDFTRFQQGPYATRLLADMGAHVLKIERPGGEWDRRLRANAAGLSSFFEAFNRGKHSAVVDINTDAGREIALRLAKDCDVVVENFRPGVMDRLGLGYEAFRNENERIIYAAGGGYGPNGPHATEPMFDMVAQAVSGVSDFVRNEEGKPRLATRGMADIGGAMFLAMAILTALYSRERTGEGQRVDASLVGACLGMHASEITISLQEQQIFRPLRRVTSTSGAFLCGDGQWLVIGATDQKLWSKLSNALERPDLGSDERFAYGAIREKNRDILEPLIEEAFLQRSREDWLERLRASGVPVAPVNTFLDLADDPDVLANGYIVTDDHPKWGPMRIVGHPFHMSGTPARVGGPAPELGVDTHDALRQAGFSEQEIAALQDDHVIELKKDEADAGDTTMSRK